MARTFTSMLLEARRRAQTQGRPLTREETTGIAEAQAKTASDRLAQAKALKLQEEAGERTERLGMADIEAAQKRLDTQLTSQREQFDLELATRQEQFDEDLAIRKQQFADQLAEAKKRREEEIRLANEQLEEQRRTREEQMAAAERSEDLAQQQKLYGTGAGAVAGAVAGYALTTPAVAAALGLAGPIGFAGAAALTVVGAFVGGGCIIVTACSDKESIEIARIYRNLYMDTEDLRGYYAIADRIVPLMNKHPWLKKAVKKLLVDRFIDYGGYVLGNKERMEYRTSRYATKGFLGVCKFIGRLKKEPIELHHIGVINNG